MPRAPGNDGAGHVEFEVDEQRAADEKKQGDVGVYEPVEQVFAEGRLHTVDLGSGEVWRLLAAVRRIISRPSRAAMRSVSLEETKSMRSLSRASSAV